jgi:hypothetical protein
MLACGSMGTLLEGRSGVILLCFQGTFRLCRNGRGVTWRLRLEVHFGNFGRRWAIATKLIDKVSDKETRRRLLQQARWGQRGSLAPSLRVLWPRIPEEQQQDGRDQRHCGQHPKNERPIAMREVLQITDPGAGKDCAEGTKAHS